MSYMGIQLQRCPECKHDREELNMIQSGAFKLRQHMYMSHPTLMIEETVCESCHRFMVDPISLPNCKHESCYCLLCFFKLLKQGGVDECPICEVDFTDLCSHIGKINGKPPDYVMNDILVEDLDVLIDEIKSACVYKKKREKDLAVLKSREEMLLQSMEKRQQSLMKMEFEKCMDDMHNEIQSNQLRIKTKSDLERYQQSKANLSHSRSEIAKQSFMFHSLGGSSSSNCNTVADQQQQQQQQQHQPIVSLLQKQEQAAKQMKQKQILLQQKQRVAELELEHRKQERKQLMNKKHERFQHLSSNVQEQLQLKLKQNALKLKLKQEHQQNKLNAAQEKFDRETEMKYWKSQDRQQEVELRALYHKEQKAYERKNAKQQNVKVQKERQLKLHELKLRFEQMSTNIISNMKIHEEKRTLLNEANENNRLKKMEQEKIKKQNMQQKISNMMLSERKAQRRRARSLEIDSLNATITRESKRQQLTTKLKQEGHLRDEVRRSAIAMLEEKEVQRIQQKLIFIQKRDDTMEKNHRIRMKTPKETWTSQKVFGRVPQVLPNFMGRSKSSSCGSKKKVKKKNRIRKNTTIDSLNSSFSSPTSLLPTLTQTKQTLTKSSSQQEEQTIIHPEILRLIEQQKHQMALLIDEEEGNEKERIKSLQRSKPIRRKQVAKSFGFKRMQAAQRIKRLEQEHKSALITIVRMNRSI